MSRQNEQEDYLGRFSNSNYQLHLCMQSILTLVFSKWQYYSYIVADLKYNFVQKQRFLQQSAILMLSLPHKLCYLLVLYNTQLEEIIAVNYPYTGTFT